MTSHTIKDLSPCDLILLSDDDLRKVVERVRVPVLTMIRFHDLRHTFASKLMMRGGNIYDLQKLLGHSDLEMTQRYAHLSPDHLADAIGIVGFSGLSDEEKEKSDLERKAHIHISSRK